jgi:hypothetical protein
MHQGRGERIRLHDIDAPENGQAFCHRAKQFVDLCYQKEVRVETKGQDRYQRMIEDVILPDGKILNYEVVKAGLAWWFRRYAPNDPTLGGLEYRAREAKRGLWLYVIQCRRRNSEETNQHLLRKGLTLDCGRRPSGEIKTLLGCSANRVKTCLAGRGAGSTAKDCCACSTSSPWTQGMLFSRCSPRKVYSLSCFSWRR